MVHASSAAVAARAQLPATELPQDPMLETSQNTESPPQGSPQGSLGNPGFLCILRFVGDLLDFLSNIKVFNQNNVF